MDHKRSWGDRLVWDPQADLLTGTGPGRVFGHATVYHGQGGGSHGTAFVWEPRLKWDGRSARLAEQSEHRGAR